MKTIFAFLLVAGALSIAAPKSSAQAASSSGTATTGNGQVATDQDIALLRQDIRSKKKQLIAANLVLTDTEATKFWPVYDQYTTEFTAISDKKVALIKDYANGYGKLTDAQALDLMKRLLAIDAQVTALREKYIPIFNGVISGVKTATFFQMDRRLSTLMDLQLASQIPLVQSQN